MRVTRLRLTGFWIAVLAFMVIGTVAGNLMPMP